MHVCQKLTNNYTIHKYVCEEIEHNFLTEKKSPGIPKLVKTQKWMSKFNVWDIVSNWHTKFYENGKI